MKSGFFFCRIRLWEIDGLRLRSSSVEGLTTQLKIIGTHQWRKNYLKCMISNLIWNSDIKNWRHFLIINNQTFIWKWVNHKKYFLKNYNSKLMMILSTMKRNQEGIGIERFPVLIPYPIKLANLNKNKNNLSLKKR